MSLHNGLDVVAIATIGVYTETYGSAAPANRANLFVSLGLFEDAPDSIISVILRGLVRLGMSLSMS